MEVIYTATQTVQPNQDVLFNDTVVGCNGNSILHRVNSGLVTLRGNTQQCRARYKISYSGNIAIPEGGTVGPIQLSLGLNGEPIASTTMIVTPAAVENFFNVSASTYVDVPKCCCFNVSVKNTSTQAIEVSQSNLIVTREA